MPRSQTELTTALIEQLGHLHRSCEAFDAGAKEEAKRLATTTCVLVEDGRRKNKSVLTQLGILDKIPFITSGVIQSRSVTAGLPLVSMRWTIKDGISSCEYIPALGEKAKYWNVPFSYWWEQPVIKDSNGLITTRHSLARALRDQDGGSHFDETLKDPAYIAIYQQLSANWFIGDGVHMHPVDPGPHLATMRQIAWELEQSLKDILAFFTGQTKPAGTSPDTPPYPRR